MFKALRTTAAAVTLVGLSVSAAVAGEAYTAANGFAVSGYDVVAYFDLEQAPVGTAQPGAVPGKSSITAEYDGATYAFATEANRDRFLANPASYAPQYDGHCAYGVAQGGKVPGNPNLWRILDGKLYLNITPTVVGFWEEDIPGNLTSSEANWPGIEGDPASTRAIPQYEPSAPVN
ncbi:MAG: YHS domain-containing (seleno)protein [Pseudomonadota bacterium]